MRLGGGSCIIERKGEDGQRACAIRIEQRRCRAAKIRQPGLVAPTIGVLVEFVVVVDRADLAVVGMGIDIEVEPRIGVLYVGAVDCREHAEQEIARDVRTGLVGTVGERVVAGQPFYIPYEAVAGMVVHPVRKVSQRHCRLP